MFDVTKRGVNKSLPCITFPFSDQWRGAGFAFPMFLNECRQIIQHLLKLRRHFRASHFLMMFVNTTIKPLVFHDFPRMQRIGRLTHEATTAKHS